MERSDRRTTMHTSAAAASCRGTEQPRKAPGGRRTTPDAASEADGGATDYEPDERRRGSGADGPPLWPEIDRSTTANSEETGAQRTRAPHDEAPGSS